MYGKVGESSSRDRRSVESVNFVAVDNDHILMRKTPKKVGRPFNPPVSSVWGKRWSSEWGKKMAESRGAKKVFDIVDTPYGDCTVVVAKRGDGFLQLEPVNWELTGGKRATFYMQDKCVKLKNRAENVQSSNEGATSSSSGYFVADELLKCRRSKSDLDDSDGTAQADIPDLCLHVPEPTEQNREGLIWTPASNGAIVDRVLSDMAFVRNSQLDSGACFKVRLRKGQKARKLCTVLSVSRGGTKEYDDNDKVSGNPVYKSKAVNEYSRGELAVILRDLKLVPNDPSKKSYVETLTEYLNAHEDIVTVYDGTKTHDVSPSDCRMVSHAYEELVHTAVHTLGENAEEASSASVNRLALDIYSQQSREAVYELGEVILQELEEVTDANASAAWTSEEVNLFCSAFLRHGDDLRAIWRLVTRGKLSSKRRSMKEIVDFFYRNFFESDGVSVKDIQEVYRVAWYGLVLEDDEEVDDDEEEENGSKRSLEINEVEDENKAESNTSDVDFDAAWKILHSTQKILNKEQLCNTLEALGITEAYELEYCNREQLLNMANCLRDIPKLVFKVTVKLESKIDVLEANGLYRRGRSARV